MCKLGVRQTDQTPASREDRSDLTLRGHEQVDIFNDIKEQFVPPVLDALTPPPNLPRNLP